MPEFVTPYLPPDAQAQAQAWKAQGRIARVWALEKQPLARCGNCQDLREVYVSFLGAGPMKSHPNNEYKNATWLEADGEKQIGAGWYIVDKTVGYKCPHCQGGYKQPPPRPRPAAKQAVKDLGEQLRIRSDIE